MLDIGTMSAPEDALGPFLRSLREASGLTLRQVEERTNGRVKNGYLSQVEAGHIGRPSPEILWHLAEAYGVPYSELLRRAGHRVPVETTERRRAINGIPLSALAELTPAERDQLVQYMSWMRHQRTRRGESDGA
jgi:transcriptional regulator with XRE-family HTH domain